MFHVYNDPVNTRRLIDQISIIVWGDNNWYTVITGIVTFNIKYGDLGITPPGTGWHLYVSDRSFDIIDSRSRWLG